MSFNSMGIQAMKVHRGLIWDHEPPSLTLGCKRFRPLAPKLSADTLSSTTTTTTTTFDLKSFIKPQSTPTKPGSSDAHSPQAAAEAGQAGGTRWNPTQEQIGILEMLYRSGMRTPNAQQIEQITAQLGKYGKIEGKNVFYWFQNHKARERQKQKRNSLGLSHSPRTPPPPPPPFPAPTSSLFLSSSSINTEEEVAENNRYKRKCMSWGFDECLEEVNKYCTEENEEEEEEEEEEEDKTLKLFPLHPEGRDSLRDCWN